MATTTVLAADFGAESGRVMAVGFSGDGLQLTEVHRFPNTPVSVRGTLYWDILRLWHELQEGIARGRAHAPASLGIDTWGVDYALLDAQGRLLGNPVHYRDQRSAGMMERAFGLVGRATIFERTGIQFLPFNTIYQLLSEVESRSPQLADAATLLTIPDLLNYWLTGTIACEFTNATTTQLLDARSGDWCGDLIEALGIPRAIFPAIAQPGTRLGSFDGLPVIAPACHDTGSAVAAVPAQTPNYAYISSGTWSLVGVEVDRPLISEAALAANVTNEGGAGGSYRLLKNVSGLWIIQQCRAYWQAQGRSFSYPELMQLAAAEPPLQFFIRPDDPAFIPPGPHPELIQSWCRRQQRPAPETPGAIVRCVLESLAFAYREVLDTLRALTGRPIDVIHIVGGGSQNELLCQMTANATGTPVVAGPVEATVIGNAVVQLIALGELSDLHEARRLVAQTGMYRRYEPADVADWDAAYQHYRQ